MTPERHRALLVAALRRSLAGGRPAVPEAGRLIWRIFVDLSAARSYSMAGPNPVTSAEIEAYARLKRWPLEPHHVETIRALDRAWLDHAGAKQGGAPRQSTAAMTPAIFDAVFK